MKSVSEKVDDMAYAGDSVIKEDVTPKKDVKSAHEKVYNNISEINVSRTKSNIIEEHKLEQNDHDQIHVNVNVNCFAKVLVSDEFLGFLNTQI